MPNYENPGKTGAEKILQRAVWLLGLAAFAAVSFNSYIGYDESYTLSLIRHPWGELIRITGADVHPPLYYLIVKAAAMPFGYAEAAVKAVNLLPLLGMYALGHTVVRRRWGSPAALWFSFLAAFLPANGTYLLPELRMYGLASLLVLACFMMSVLIAEERYDIVKTKTAWVLFFLSGVGAAYTQYYALIAVALIYLALAFRLLRGGTRGEKARWRGWWISAALSAACYLPWLFVLVEQFRSVSGGYWIPPLSLRNYLSFFMFPFYSSLPAWAGLILALAVAAVTAGAAWRFIRDKGKDAQELLQRRLFAAAAGSAAFAYLGMIAVGVAVSLLVRPVFSVRYVKCVLGLLVFVMAVFFAGCGRRRQRLLAAAFVTFAVLNLAVIVWKNGHNNEQFAAMEAFTEEHMDPEAVILYPEDGHYMGVFSYWFREHKNVIPDKNYTDEYMAYAPALMTESGYEAGYGRLEEKEIWTVDIGNIRGWKAINGREYEVVESSPDFVFYDATDSLPCVLTRIRLTGGRLEE